MQRLLFLLFVLGCSTQWLQGQQTISSFGGVFENERISCQLTLGELEVVSPQKPGNPSIQLISGTFSPSNGKEATTGNESLVAGKPLVAITWHDRYLSFVQPQERETDCHIYSTRGVLVHCASFRGVRHEIMLHSLSSGIYFIRIVQGKQCQTYKLNIP